MRKFLCLLLGMLKRYCSATQVRLCLGLQSPLDLISIRHISFHRHIASYSALAQSISTVQSNLRGLLILISINSMGASRQILRANLRATQSLASIGQAPNAAATIMTVILLNTLMILWAAAGMGILCLSMKAQWMSYCLQ